MIAQMEIGSLGVFADSGQLVDLQKYVDAEEFDLDDFMPGLLDASYYDGKLIALPIPEAFRCFTTIRISSPRRALRIRRRLGMS